MPMMSDNKRRRTVAKQRKARNTTKRAAKEVSSSVEASLRQARDKR